MGPSDAALSRIAFATIVAGVAVLIIAVVWGGQVYPGYDHTRQYMSELGATGAVTGPAVSAWGFVPNGVMVAAFCLMTAWILRRSGLAVVACLLLALNGMGMAGAGIYPCDFGCGRSDPSTAAQMHDLTAGLGYLFALPGLGLAALWARRSDAPWLAPLGAVALVISIAGFVAIIADVELGGLFQRVMEAAMAVFMLALGWAVMRGVRGAPRPRS